ncbi:MAG: DUF1127 domain-containing protein [Dongiaceae bacterium]
MKYQADGMLDLVPRSGLAHIVATELAPALDRLIEAPVIWLERMRERRQLAAFNDNMLKDIGVSRADVEHVVEKPFWRA